MIVRQQNNKGGKKKIESHSRDKTPLIFIFFRIGLALKLFSGCYITGHTAQGGPKCFETRGI